MSDQFKPIDFSKYSELRNLWNMHPSNTEGALYKGYKPAEGETAQVLRRYGELSQQLADEVGGGKLYTEAMIALGGVGGIGNGLTGENLGDPNYYKNMMTRRQQFLDSGRSVQDADANEAYRFASVMTGQRPADLNYIQAERLRQYTAQYGTPEQYNYANQQAELLRSAQPQAATTNYLQPNFQNTQTQQILSQPQAMTTQSQQPMPAFSFPVAQSQAAQPAYRLSNMLAGNYMQPNAQNAQQQSSIPAQSFGISNITSGQYSQPIFQNAQSGLQSVYPNPQLSQLNLKSIQP